MMKKYSSVIHYHRNTVIKFGKHYGRTVAQVLEDDPGYLVWASESIRDFDLDADILDDAINRNSYDEYERYLGFDPPF